MATGDIGTVTPTSMLQCKTDVHGTKTRKPRDGKESMVFFNQHDVSAAVEQTIISYEGIQFDLELFHRDKFTPIKLPNTKEELYG